MVDIAPTIPIDYASLKATLRLGLQNHESRSYWWPYLPCIGVDETADKYPEVIETAERLTVILAEPLLDVKTQVKFSAENPTEFIDTMIKRLLYVLVNSKKLEMSGVSFIEPLVRLLLYVIKRVDVCYLVASDLVANKEKYIDFGASGSHSMSYVFKGLLKNYIPKTYEALHVMGALDDKYLNSMFIGLFTELFPEHIVLKIIDAFLLEGVKILFRYGLALFRGYKQQIKSGKYATAKEFWISVKADAVSAANQANTAMLYKTLGLEEFLPPIDPFLLFSNAKNKEFIQSNLINQYPFDMDRGLFAKMIRPMNISKSNLKTLSAAARNVAPPVDNSPATANASLRKSSFVRTSITEKSHELQQPTNATNVGNVLGARKASLGGPRLSLSSNTGGGSPTPMISPNGNNNNNKNRTPSNASDGNTTPAVERDFLIHELSNVSTIFDKNTTLIRKFLNYLPENLLFEGIDLVYSTTNDGFNLDTIYAQARELLPTVILIQLASPHEHVILGAYVNESLSPPQNKIRGDKNTIIFRLDENHEVKYGWNQSGADQKKTTSSAVQNEINNEGDDSVARTITDENIDNELDLKNSTYYQFMVSATKYISFGASHKLASNAIRIDSDLKYIHLGHSDTFNNPPLYIPEHNGEDANTTAANAYSLEIKEVEVYCGGHSVKKAKEQGKFKVKVSVLDK